MADEQNLDNQAPGTRDAVDGGADLAAQVTALEEQLAAAKDQSLRAVAELQNVRPRAEHDRAKAHQSALAQFAAALQVVLHALARGRDVHAPAEVATRPIR